MDMLHMAQQRPLTLGELTQAAGMLALAAEIRMLEKV
jgi:hypothetical protein